MKTEFPEKNGRAFLQNHKLCDIQTIQKEIVWTDLIRQKMQT